MDIKNVREEELNTCYNGNYTNHLTDLIKHFMDKFNLNSLIKISKIIHLYSDNEILKYYIEICAPALRVISYHSSMREIVSTALDFAIKNHVSLSETIQNIKDNTKKRQAVNIKIAYAQLVPTINSVINGSDIDIDDSRAMLNRHQYVLYELSKLDLTNYPNNHIANKEFKLYITHLLIKENPSV